MTIKLEDIRVGDKATLKEGVVTAVRDGSAVYPVSIDFGGDVGSFALSSIATHTPAPREFKHGDTVTWGKGFNCGTFLMSHGGLAFIAHEDGTPDTIQLVGLRHADDPTLAPQEPAKERRKIEFWENAYSDGSFGRWPSKSSADAAANSCGLNRIACLHVEGYEGDGL